MAKKKVLIVDDEKDFVEMLSDRLQAKGYEIIKAFDGAEGLEKARASKPDLIILDIIMPKMDGFDVCRKLKIDKEYKKIPVIMLTAKFQHSDINFADEMGADTYITKPLELGLLSDKIKELLRKGSLKAALKNGAKGKT